MDPEIIKEQLKCPVCKQVFVCPVRLPCGHNVCRSCLKLHIIRTVQTSGCTIQGYQGQDDVLRKPESKGFKCPVDEEEILMPHSNNDVNQWVYQFENNLDIVNIVEICRGKSRGLMEICDNCIEMSQTDVAVSVCFTCLKKYCVKCANIHRYTHPKDVVKYVRVLRGILKDETIGQSKSSMINKTCKIHLFSELSLYCMDCKTVCCHLCQSTVHSECRHVFQVNQSVNGFVGHDIQAELGDRCVELLKQIADILKDDLELNEAILQLKQSNDDSGNSCFKEMKRTLHGQISYKQSQYEHLKALQTAIEETKSGKMNPEEILHARVECQRLENELKLYKNKDGGKETRLNAFKEALEISNYEKNENRVENTQENRAHTPPNKNTLSLQNYFLLNFATDKELVKVDATKRFDLLEKVDMKAPGDNVACWLIDCAFVNENFIIAADYANKCIKWQEGASGVRKLPLESSPRCIAVDHSALIGCLTLPTVSKIQIVHIGSETITLANTFETKEECHGVDMMDSKIFALCKGKEFVFKILTTDGIAIRNISCSDNTLKGTSFCNPKFLCVRKMGQHTRIYFTDFRLCTLTCLTFNDIEGELSAESSVRHIDGYPLGIDVTSDGNVLVCLNSIGEIHQVIEGCEQRHVLVRSLWQPRALSFLKQGNRFMVTTDSGPSQNCVLIYRSMSRAC